MKNDFNDFMHFRNMVSFELIATAYMFGALLLTGTGFTMTLLKTWELFGYGMGLLVGGNLVWRVLCECLILMFSAHRLLSEIRNSLSKEPEI